mmetsp:Transcript_18189/g.51961  ORF Transcript_18189/g.51961 Transcript_18189/m.51961 type:complete len:304 (+) Transcript_18189:302-1213(+)
METGLHGRLGHAWHAGVPSKAAGRGTGHNAAAALPVEVHDPGRELEEPLVAASGRHPYHVRRGHGAHAVLRLQPRSVLRRHGLARRVVLDLGHGPHLLRLLRDRWLPGQRPLAGGVELCQDLVASRCGRVVDGLDLRRLGAGRNGQQVLAHRQGPPSVAGHPLPEGRAMLPGRRGQLALAGSRNRPEALHGLGRRRACGALCSLYLVRPWAPLFGGARHPELADHVGRGEGLRGGRLGACVRPGHVVGLRHVRDVHPSGTGADELVGGVVLHVGDRLVGRRPGLRVQPVHDLFDTGARALPRL